MKTYRPLTALQAMDATRKAGHGNRAHRRLLSRFEIKSGRIIALPVFRPQWFALIARSPAVAESLAYRLAKLANRPLDMVCPPSSVTCNNIQYQPNCFNRSVINS